MVELSRDYSAMAEIWLETSIKAHHFINEKWWFDNYDAMAELFLPGCVNYVYRDDITEDIEAFISLNRGHIHALFVSVDKQGKGVGKSLLDYAKSLYQTLTLCVYEENIKAVNFYLNQGFKIMDRRVEPGTGHMELLMEFK